MTEAWNDRGWVYLVKCGKLYKVGRATDVERRLKELNTGSAYPLQLKHKVQSLSFQRLETWLHKKFKPWHAKGEWFELPLTVTRWFCSKNGSHLDRLMTLDIVCQDCSATTFDVCCCTIYSGRTPYDPTNRMQRWSKDGALLEECRHCGRWFQSRAAEIYCRECRTLGITLDAMGLMPENMYRLPNNPKPDWTYYQKPRYIPAPDEDLF